ncbi:hypothetical protein [Embleya sp. NPDC005971]|uniref:hypothetical protein n=1 Tax=Embleya sp. NPDC005971 TaxID=3156724 RepID=UPI0033FCB215
MTDDDVLAAELLAATERMITENFRSRRMPSHARAPGGGQSGRLVPIALRLVASARPRRMWQGQRWAELGHLAPHVHMALAIGGIHHHSHLQEPHGGRECANPQVYQETIPDWVRMQRADGRRTGPGTLVGSILVAHPEAGPLLVAGPVRECTVRTDMCGVLHGLPASVSGLL